MTPLATRIAKRADRLPRASDRLVLRKKALITDKLDLENRMVKATAEAIAERNAQRRESRGGVKS
jgi:hypothetical protein